MNWKRFLGRAVISSVLTESGWAFQNLPADGFLIYADNPTIFEKEFNSVARHIPTAIPIRPNQRPQKGRDGRCEERIFPETRSVKVRVSCCASVARRNISEAALNVPR
jgi:hypothetical protein